MKHKFQYLDAREHMTITTKSIWNNVEEKQREEVDEKKEKPELC